MTNENEEEASSRDDHQSFPASPGDAEGDASVPNRQQQEDQGNAPRDGAEPDPSGPNPPQGENVTGGELEHEGREPEVGHEAIDLAARVAHIILAEVKEESFTGLLPHPDHWDRYGPDAQERLLRMAEAPTSDESRRRDDLVRAEISEAPKDRRAALSVYFGSVVAALIAEGAFEATVLACAFVAVPVMKVVSDFIAPRRPGVRNKDDGGE